MTLRCVIHSVVFSAEGLPVGMAHECPVCLRDELDKVRETLATIRSDRDVLVAAIEIKRHANLVEVKP